MNESKPSIFEQGETSNRVSYAREEIPTQERPQGQYFRINKPKKDYKTPGEYRERPINHDSVWLDLDCIKDRDKTITAWVKSMKMALAFHKIDRDNCIEFLKTSFIGIVSHWFMGLKDTNKNRILYGENNYRNENFDQVLNRFENEIRKEFLGEDWEIDFQQEIKRN